MKDAVLKNRKLVIGFDLASENEKGNFTFYLKNHPDVRIQFTSKRYFLKLHGLRPHGFLLDLKVIRELTLMLKDFYPQGIDFKLDKENLGYRDQDEIMAMQNRALNLQQQMINKALVSRESFEHFKNELWKGYETEPEIRDQFAEGLNNVFAQMICENGFRFKPSGKLKFKVHFENRRINLLLDKYVNALTTSGFL